MLQKLKELLLVVQTEDKKIVFPSILPTNDPDFLNELNNSENYTLYGTFNAHVEFMPMGLFSQWVVKWLSLDKEKNNDIKLEEHHYSQFCCILSSTSVYLVVKWHPYYKTLMFDFYHPKNENKDHLNAFALLLSNTLETIALHKNWLIADNELCDYMQSSNTDIINHFIQGLQKISRTGLSQDYPLKNKKNGEKNVTHITNIKENYGALSQGDHNTINQTITVTKNNQNNYLNALEQLKEAYMAEPKNTQQKENFQKIYEAAKADVIEGELSEEKVSFMDSLVKRSKDATTVGKCVELLVKLYGAVASLI